MNAIQTNINSHSMKRPRILLMEDEAAVAKGFQMVLTEEGYGVDLAMTGQIALDTINRQGYDLLVADLRLPDMDGMEVIKQVRDTRPEIQVIVVTGYADVTSAVAAIKAGVHDYLSKPLTEQEVIAAVGKALKERCAAHSARDPSQRDSEGEEVGYIGKKDVVHALWEVEIDSAPRASADDLAVGPLPTHWPNGPKDWNASPKVLGTAGEIPPVPGRLSEKQLVENAPAGIMAWDRNATVTAFNRRMEAMFGYAKEEIIGHATFDRFFPVGSAEQLLLDIRNGQGGRSNTILLPETDMMHKAGTVVPVQLSATALFDHGKEDGVVIVVQDIKEFRAMEQAVADLPQLLHQNKMMSLGRLAASIVHEINNPLSGILNYVRMMLKQLHGNAATDARSSEKFIRYLALVEGEVSRCAAIVTNLLAFSRKAGMGFSAVNVADLLQKCIMLSQHKLEMDNIRLAVEIDATIPEICGDFNQIQQCVINLVFNGIDAMEKGGTLTLGCGYDQRAKMVVIWVRDDGCGISQENQAHIFDPFFTTKEEGRGLGLGLATVSKIITQHNGTIHVESRIGQGTTFTIKLPTVEAPQT